jgi:DNA primase
VYDRDAVLASVDLRVLADDLLGPSQGTPAARKWPCPNPTHTQTGRTPPVSIFKTHKGEQRWRCHGCGTGGSGIDLVMATHRVPVGDAIEWLAQRTRLEHLPPPPSSRTRPTTPGRDTARRALREEPSTSLRDRTQMDRYVNQCATALRTEPAADIHRWLTEQRHITDAVLRANRIGADLGPARQSRPNGIPRGSGVVLPVFTNGCATYVQLRIHNAQGDQPRYLNPTTALAPNPKISHLQPADVAHDEILITEGTLDALSAATAGYRSVALLSAAYPDQAIAYHLSRLPAPLVIAFDNDNAGQQAASQLATLLAAQGRPTPQLALPPGRDLNDLHTTTPDWSDELAHNITNASTANRTTHHTAAIAR